jgi:hypothetical protein
MRSTRATPGLLVGTMILTAALLPSTAAAETRAFSDPAGDIHSGADVRKVLVRNEAGVVVTVAHRDLRRAKTPGVGIWFDTNRARSGPEFLAALNIYETYFWPVRRWKVYGEAPLACPMSGGLFYKADITRVRVSRSCLGRPERVRVSVSAGQSSREDWAPGYHKFFPWVRRGSLAGTIEGTPGDDTLSGTPAADRIDAKAGDDLVYARDGADLVYGRRGDDRIYLGPGEATADRPGDSGEGGAGNDQIYGGRGPDNFNGGAGNDLLVGGPGPDVMFDGRGADTLRTGAGGDGIDVGEGSDSVSLGPDNDSVAVYADGSRDIIRCGSGRDRVYFHGGREKQDVLRDCEVKTLVTPDGEG